MKDTTTREWAGGDPPPRPPERPEPEDAERLEAIKAMHRAMADPYCSTGECSACWLFSYADRLAARLGAERAAREEAEAARDAYRLLADGRDRLLACYRLGTRRGMETAMRLIDRGTRKLAAARERGDARSGGAVEGE